MKLSANIIGIIFILVGTLTFAYQGFTYTKQEKIAQVGDVKLTTDVNKSVYLPPVIGGISLATGIVLVIVGSL